MALYPPTFQSYIGYRAFISFYRKRDTLPITLQPTRIIDALSLTLNNIFGLFAGMLIAILALGIGPRSDVKKKLTRKSVYLMLACVVGLLIIIWYSLSILRQAM